MKLMIISPQQRKSYQVHGLKLILLYGNFVIQPGHAPTILFLLLESLVTYLPSKNGRTGESLR